MMYHGRYAILTGTLAVFMAMVMVAVAAPTSARAEDDSDAVSHAKSLSEAFRRAAESTTPAVVTVVAKHPVGNAIGPRNLRELFNDPEFRRRFPEGRIPFEIPEQEEGDGNEEGEEGDSENPWFPGFATNVGSGVVIDKSGIVLTNNHVVESADEVVVRLQDGSEIVAHEILTDRLSDVAILRIRAEDDTEIHAATLGDSDRLAIGDWVIAIGSPFELEATVSAGIISAKGRGIRRIERARLIQTDAAINPGNSGGPLVNLDGEVVGINTAIATSNGGYQGVGFAIPINQARWIAEELQEHGEVRRAWLGTGIGELDAAAARQLNLRARSGVRVVSVYPGSPADQAGLLDDDVIVEFGGTRVRSPGDLQAAVEQQPIGAARKMVVVRKGDRVTVDVTLEALPGRAGRPR